jgi:hypothetical protein
MTSRASALRDAMKERFYPFADRQGFVREKAAHSLFTAFRRQRNGKVQLFDIQWEKYHRPYFVLNFGEAPVGDLAVNGTLIAAENVRAADCPLGGRLQRRRGGSLGCWFRLRKPMGAVLLSGVVNYRAEQVADEVIEAFQELEAWWESKVVGPHVHVFQ